MRLLRLPRVDLSKMAAVEPSQRRPTVDLMGDSLGRLGTVRLLMPDDQSTTPAPIDAVAGALAGLERYYGLDPGRLWNRVRREPLPEPLSVGGPLDLDPRVAAVVQWSGAGERFGEDVEAEIPMTLNDGSSVSWKRRERELLFIVGPVLSGWTNAVLPALDSVDQLRVTIGSEKEKPRLRLTWFGLDDPDDLERLPEFG